MSFMRSVESDSVRIARLLWCSPPSPPSTDDENEPDAAAVPAADWPKRAAKPTGMPLSALLLLLLLACLSKDRILSAFFWLGVRRGMRCRDDDDEEEPPPRSMDWIGAPRDKSFS